MPPPRRAKAFGLIIILTVLITFYITSGARQTQTSDFYTKTQEALQVREYELATKQRDADDVGSRLKAAEEAAKKSAEQKGQKYMDAVSGSEKSVAGRVMIQDDEKKPVQGVAQVGGRPGDREAAKNRKATPEEHEVEVELNAILKRSPIIIFSKTFCPFSRKAKHILLDLYDIEPVPYVVELDEHPLGAKLQATLGDTTGRKTVPNVLILGVSIGGGDDMEELHETGLLADKIKEMGGSRITQASLRETKSEMRRKRRV
ncbi:glutaredoxin domain-containing protein [Lojkania enalia]|uniref:Glutaredoxin domain-containing protein n=1 Tax=Lojkania enalia TaxID=147567 RepID=A0A9P4JXS4_9PLEO|nr:glutaredoxin domain-containing protein [Didymosphaeria enalia]